MFSFHFLFFSCISDKAHSVVKQSGGVVLEPVPNNGKKKIFDQSLISSYLFVPCAFPQMSNVLNGNKVRKH